MEILDKDTIEKEIMVQLPTAKRGYECSVPLWEVVGAIIYKLKTGVQWRFLPVDSLIDSDDYTWGGVYHHFRKWCKSGSWQKVWERLLNKYKQHLDLSSADLDGSHTPAKRGGEKVSYQGRKKCKTSNMLFLSDNQGNMLACSPVIAGNHNDLYQIEHTFEQLCQTLQNAGICLKGLFMNADAGFDSQAFTEQCQQKEIILNVCENKRNNAEKVNHHYIFDELLYEERYVVERANAWIDAFKTLLIRFETKAQHWLEWHYLAFSVRFLTKIGKV
jgi:transposase